MVSCGFDEKKQRDEQKQRLWVAIEVIGRRGCKLQWDEIQLEGRSAVDVQRYGEINSRVWGALERAGKLLEKTGESISRFVYELERRRTGSRGYKHRRWRARWPTLSGLRLGDVRACELCCSSSLPPSLWTLSAHSKLNQSVRVARAVEERTKVQRATASRVPEE